MLFRADFVSQSMSQVQSCLVVKDHRYVLSYQTSPILSSIYPRSMLAPAPIRREKFLGGKGQAKKRDSNHKFWSCHLYLIDTSARHHRKHVPLSGHGLLNNVETQFLFLSPNLTPIGLRTRA